MAPLVLSSLGARRKWGWGYWGVHRLRWTCRGGRGGVGVTRRRLIAESIWCC